MKLLMENWREYLTEEELLEEDLTALMGALPDWRVVRQTWKNVSARGATWEDILKKIGKGIAKQLWPRSPNEHQRMETESDSIIEKLQLSDPFWYNIFERVESGKKDVGQIVESFHRDGKIQGDIEEWMKIVELVISFYLSNKDETFLEVIEAIAEPLGESSKSKTAAWKQAIWMVSLSAAGYFGGEAMASGEDETAVAVIGAGIGLVPWGIGKLDSYIKEKDWDNHITPFLQKLGLDTDSEYAISLRMGFDEKKADKFILAFHRIEYHILKQLEENPRRLPTAPWGDVATQFKKEMDEIIDGGLESANALTKLMPRTKEQKEDLQNIVSGQADLSADGPGEEPQEKYPKTDWSGQVVAESKNFHDNWRAFLITEEKK